MKWYVRSSSGRDTVSVDFIKQYEGTDAREFLVSRVEITGNFWGRFDEIFEGDEVEDFTVVLHQVCFCREQLQEFLRQLEAWLQHPSPISIDLGPGLRDDQKFKITIGKHEEYISSDEKPVCTIESSLGVFRYGKWMFVLDQSCIRLLVEELGEALKACETSL